MELFKELHRLLEVLSITYEFELSVKTSLKDTSSSSDARFRNEEISC